MRFVLCDASFTLREVFGEYHELEFGNNYQHAVLGSIDSASVIDNDCILYFLLGQLKSLLPLPPKVPTFTSLSHPHREIFFLHSSLAYVGLCTVSCLRLIDCQPHAPRLGLLHVLSHTVHAPVPIYVPTLFCLCVRLVLLVLMLCFFCIFFVCYLCLLLVFVCF